MIQLKDYILYNRLVFERYGKYNGQTDIAHQLAIEISNDYYNNYTSQSKTYEIDADEINYGASEDEMFPGFFYHKIQIIADPKHPSTSYLCLDNNFDYKENKFHNVKIRIGKHDIFNNKSSLFKTIMHELTHAWHDYNSFLKDGLGNNRAKSLSTLSRESKYYNNIRGDKPKRGSVESLCKSIMYLLTKFESNAYASEIYCELEEHNGEILSWDDAKNIFTNSETYRAFIRINNSLNKLNSSNDIELQHMFANYYNTHNSTNLSFNKIYKSMHNKLEKLFKHIMDNCMKIYCEWSEKQNS